MKLLFLPYRNLDATLRKIVFILLFVFPCTLLAQTQMTITGTVKDEAGNMLAGSLIKVKGSSTATVTDKNGVFRLFFKGTNPTLVVSYLGFATKNVSIENNNPLDIRLVSVEKKLEEVVVIGYSTIKKKDLTGSVASVNMNEFSKAPVKSFDDALAGRVAGVQVSGNDGQPGTTNNIVVRGYGSITQDNSPLYVVDGFPLESSNSNSINPSDIESIEVLKDASATAIYGARGANGVIMITTKKGKASEHPIVSYNGYFGRQDNTKRIALMTPYQYVQYHLEFKDTARLLSDGKTLQTYADMPNLDLQNYIFRVAAMQSHDLAVRGGNKETKYSFSGNALNQDGVVINSGFKRYQGRLTLDESINDKIRVGGSVNISNSKSHGVQVSESSYSSMLSLLANVWGYSPLTNGNDSLLLLPFDPEITNHNGDYRFNPVINAQNQLKESNVNNQTVNTYLQYTIVPNLIFKVTGGVSNITTVKNVFNNTKTQSGNSLLPNNKGVNGSTSTTTSSNWVNENTLTYNKNFKQKHSLNLLVGITSQGENDTYSSISANYLPNESLGIAGLSQAPSDALYANTSSSNWTLASFLGRVTYGYDSKYLATASFRADGSSKFSPENKWGYFPSASFAWRFSKESFMQNFHWLNDGKVRIGFGNTGNNRVDDFSYLGQMGANNNAYSYNNNIVYGSPVTVLGNKNLKWEITSQTNLGFDLAFFNGSLACTVDFYDKISKNLLLNATIPSSSGFQNTYKNIGSVDNRGLEISITNSVRKNRLTWVSSFNISFNQNKVIALSDNQNALFSTVGFDSRYGSNPLYVASIGKPMGQIYGLKWEGVYQYSDFDMTPQGKYILKSNINDNGTIRNNIQPGDIKYKDLNGDGTVNSSDYTVIGRGLPIFVGGFSNTFTYKSFDASVLLQFNYGNDIFNANRLIFEGNGLNSPAINQYASYSNRWEPNRPSNTLYRAGGQGLPYYSSRVIEDGSFIKLKTVSIGYTLKGNNLKLIKFNSIRVYASGQNLYTWSKYSGNDPEVSVRNSALTPGFDYSAYPRARTFVVGVNVIF